MPKRHKIAQVQELMALGRSSRSSGSSGSSAWCSVCLPGGIIICFFGRLLLLLRCLWCRGAGFFFNLGAMDFGGVALFSFLPLFSGPRLRETFFSGTKLTPRTILLWKRVRSRNESSVNSAGPRLRGSSSCRLTRQLC